MFNVFNSEIKFDMWVFTKYQSDRKDSFCRTEILLVRYNRTLKFSVRLQFYSIFLQSLLQSLQIEKSYFNSNYLSNTDALFYIWNLNLK